MVKLDPDPFLNELTKLFEKSKTAGSVWVTFKRSSLKPGGRKRKVKEAEGESSESVGEDSEYRCLVRATNGKKKFSTTISAKDQLRFQAAYSTVLKAHMDSLKKKEKKEKKEKKDKKDKKKPAAKPSAVS